MLVTLKHYTELKSLEIPKLLQQHDEIFKPYWDRWRLDESLETDENEMQVLHEKHRLELAERLEKFKNILAEMGEKEPSEIVAILGRDQYKWDWFFTELAKEL